MSPPTIRSTKHEDLASLMDAEIRLMEACDSDNKNVINESLKLCNAANKAAAAAAALATTLSRLALGQESLHRALVSQQNSTEYLNENRSKQTAHRSLLIATLFKKVQDYERGDRVISSSAIPASDQSSRKCSPSFPTGQEVLVRSPHTPENNYTAILKGAEAENTNQATPAANNSPPKNHTAQVSRNVAPKSTHHRAPSKSVSPTKRQPVLSTTPNSSRNPSRLSLARSDAPGSRTPSRGRSFARAMDSTAASRAKMAKQEEDDVFKTCSNRCDLTDDMACGCSAHHKSPARKI